MNGKTLPSRRFERILFIDDDPNVLEAASNLLSLSGYTVTTARTTAEAEVEIKAGQFDVMMTDLTMPERSGWELARRAKEIWPDKPVVLVTGWGLQLQAKQKSAEVIDGVLTKPFTIDDLSQMLENLPVRRAR